MEKLNDVIFYHLDKAIKTYRQFAQHQLTKSGFSLTIDQWLVLKKLHEQPNIKQHEIAETVFERQCIHYKNYRLTGKEKVYSKISSPY